MPDDPIVNDHYGDLWKLDRKFKLIFLVKYLLMNDVENEMVEKINFKISNGLKS